MVLGQGLLERRSGAKWQRNPQTSKPTRALSEFLKGLGFRSSVEDYIGEGYRG